MENQTQAASLGLGTAELPELLTLQQASKILKVHPNTLRNWERAGVIPVVRVGPRRDRRFPKHGIHQFLPGQQPATNLAGAPIETAPAESSVEPQAGSSVNQAAAVTPEGVEVPISVAESDLVSETMPEESAVAQATPEAAEVILNVPPRRSSILFRTVIGIALITLAVATIGILFRQLSFREPTKQSSGFAVRRNPPSVLFADSFEAYEIGQIPRTVWSSIGLWTVKGQDGKKYLKGEASVENPLGLMSHIYTGSGTWKDYQFKFDGRVVSGEKSITAMVGYLDEDNYYHISFSEKEVSVILVSGGRQTELGRSSLTNIDPPLFNDGNWRTFSINLLGSKIDAFVDGKLVISANDSQFTLGKVGLAAKNQIVEFDNVQIIQQTGQSQPN